MIYFNDKPPDIKTDIKEPHNYVKCNKIIQLTEYHKDISKWDYYMLSRDTTTKLDAKQINANEVYYCVNTLIICTNKDNITDYKANKYWGAVSNLYKYMKERFPYFDDKNIDTWDKEFKNNKKKISTVNGYFPIIEKIVDPTYKSKKYTFIIFHGCGPINYEKYHIFSILLYLKLYGYIVISLSNNIVHIGIIEKLIATYDNNIYFKVIQQPYIYNSDTDNAINISVLQKIRELNDNDEERAKTFCKWIS